jgi:hypothetical protein
MTGPEEFKFLAFVIPLLPQLSGFSSSPVTAVARSTGLCGPPVSDGPLCFFRFKAPARLLRDFLLDTAQETTLGPDEATYWDRSTRERGELTDPF